MKDMMDNNARRGDIRIYKGQDFACVGFRAHPRRDGTETNLIRWQSLCSVCLKEYEFEAPFHVDMIYPIRTCKDHRAKQAKRRKPRRALTE